MVCGYDDTQNNERVINFRLEGKHSEVRREVILTPHNLNTVWLNVGVVQRLPNWVRDGVFRAYETITFWQFI